ncbi:MAG TPA: hypothetical protein VK970_17925 [Candidatus Methylacidiphilales bacterium]|nr:hypothetical protein [Candidatus Methylacidiphilales bacterium]
MNTPHLLNHTSRQTLAALSKGAHRALRLVAAAALLGISATVVSFAGPEIAAPDPKAKSEDKPASSRFSGLLNIDVSNQRITPRGLNIENQGVVFQPMLILGYDVYRCEDPNAFINNVNLYGGNWNSVHTHASGNATNVGNWNETDPFVGVATTFAKDFKFDVTGTFFISGDNAFDTSTNVNFKLSYADKFLPYGITLNPAIEAFVETTGKSTFVFDSASSKQSFYFVLSIDPTYQFKTIPLTVEMPTFINICDEDFYQKADGSGGGAGVALVSTSIRLSTPLTFMPECAGKWTAYVSGQYYHLFNEGALEGNTAFGGNSGKREEDMAQVHGGITCKF